jgi:hypothetical protein
VNRGWSGSNGHWSRSNIHWSRSDIYGSWSNVDRRRRRRNVRHRGRHFDVDQYFASSLFRVTVVDMYESLY